ncbi:SPOR domain-containing protein [candidate division KSB1 bacterium]|nr:SPOR domain-containing protein [candidate division KSB1 bacterium]
MKSYFFMCIAGLLIMGCGGAKQQTVNTDTTPPERRQGKILEDFDPLTLNDEDLTIKSTRSVEAKSDYDDSFLPDMDSEQTGATESDGYRVQICAVSVEDTARNIQRDAILKLNENVYLKFDSPYYKVRIGDCKTRYEAEQLQRLAIQKGFNEAWVVKTTIQLKPHEEKEDTTNLVPTQP